MSGNPSAIGLGFQPFGDYPFGSADWAEEVTWRILPEFVKYEDGTEGNVPDPLRGWIEVVKPFLQEIIDTWENFPDLWDANRVRIDLLPSLAYNVGIALDPTQEERLQRSEVLNAAQLFIHKGTDRGYRIVAAFDGLIVVITPLWAENKASGAALTESPPTEFFPKFDVVAGDDLPLDSSFDDIFALWPTELFFGEECRTHSLRLFFTTPDDTEIDDYEAVSSRVLLRLERFRPMHVRLDSVAFDGPKGSSQVWTASVNAENSGSSQVWTAPVIAELVASTQVWVATVNADTV